MRKDGGPEIDLKDGEAPAWTRWRDGWRRDFLLAGIAHAAAFAAVVFSFVEPVTVILGAAIEYLALILWMGWRALEGSLAAQSGARVVQFFLPALLGFGMLAYQTWPRDSGLSFLVTAALWSVLLGAPLVASERRRTPRDRFTYRDLAGIAVFGLGGVVVLVERIQEPRLVAMLATTSGFAAAAVRMVGRGSHPPRWARARAV